MAIEHVTADDGPWFLGANKDNVGISYTFPCSQDGAGGKEYTITVYALACLFAGGKLAERNLPGDVGCDRNGDGAWHRNADVRGSKGPTDILVGTVMGIPAE